MLASRVHRLLGILALLSPALCQNRELVPTDSPTNLTLLEIREKQVLIEWQRVDPSSVRGSFRGYLVRTWNHAGSQVYAFPPEVTKASVEFFPYSKNFVTVSARNDKYVGPPSEAISFDAPQIEPNSPQPVTAFSLGNDSIFLQWGKPTLPNGILTGYKISCKPMDDETREAEEVFLQVNDPDRLQAKLTGLKEEVTYRVGVAATNCAGEGPKQTTEIKLESHEPAEPYPPKFLYKIGYKPIDREVECAKLTDQRIFEFTEKEVDYEELQEKGEVQVVEAVTPKPGGAICLVDTLILWRPDVLNNPGSHFYLRYRKRGEEEFKVTEPIMEEDFVVLRDFDACKNYEVILTAVDGEFSTDSAVMVTPTRI